MGGADGANVVGAGKGLGPMPSFRIVNKVTDHLAYKHDYMYSHMGQMDPYILPSTQTSADFDLVRSIFHSGHYIDTAIVGAGLTVGRLFGVTQKHYSQIPSVLEAARNRLRHIHDEIEPEVDSIMPAPSSTSEYVLQHQIVDSNEHGLQQPDDEEDIRFLFAENFDNSSSTSSSTFVQHNENVIAANNSYILPHNVYQPIDQAIPVMQELRKHDQYYQIDKRIRDLFKGDEPYVTEIIKKYRK